MVKHTRPHSTIELAGKLYVWVHRSLVYPNMQSPCSFNFISLDDNVRWRVGLSTLVETFQHVDSRIQSSMVIQLSLRMINQLPTHKRRPLISHKASELKVLEVTGFRFFFNWVRFLLSCSIFLTEKLKENVQWPLHTLSLPPFLAPSPLPPRLLLPPSPFPSPFSPNKRPQLRENLRFRVAGIPFLYIKRSSHSMGCLT